MSKKRKSKKRRNTNIVDSRIKTNLSKEDYKRERLYKDLEKYHYYFISIGSVDQEITLKSTGKVLAKDILVYRLNLIVREHRIRREYILVEELDHCFIEEILIPDLLDSYSHSMVEMKEYRRERDGSVSYCFCRPSKVYLAEVQYTDILMDSLIQYGDDLSQEGQIELIETFLDVKRYSCEALEEYYLTNCSLIFKQFRKLRDYLVRDLKSHERKIERFINVLERF